MSFRYDVAPSASMKTYIFKPNPIEDGGTDIRAASFGALYQGNFHKVVRNELANLVWEAGS